MAQVEDPGFWIAFLTVLSMIGGACAGAPRRTLEVGYIYLPWTPKFTWAHVLEAWIGGPLVVLLSAGLAWNLANGWAGGPRRRAGVGILVLGLGGLAFVAARRATAGSDDA